MRTTVTIEDDDFHELMRIADTDNRTEAVNIAIRAYIRAQRIRRFKALRGAVPEFPDNSELEEPDVARAKQLAADTE